MITPEQARAALQAVQRIYKLADNSARLGNDEARETMSGIRHLAREAAALLEPVGEKETP
jgi:hypothetical protein